MAFLAIVPLLAATPAIAQGVSGTVRDSVSGRPVAGAVVMLVDSLRTVLARNITDERGRYRVSAGASALYLRVVRIGFQPRELGLSGPGGKIQSLDVAMMRFSTALAPIRVADKTQCPRRPDAAATAALWEQARAGLLATVVAREANPAAIHRLTFERTFDGGSDRITRFLVFADSATAAAKSFTAVSSAQEFVKTGFARDSAGIQILYAPDADVLLDDAFGAGYCFRMAEPVRARPHDVGLSFAPAEKGHGRVDIDGTLWLDTAAHALKEVGFQYVGLPAPAEPFHPGGLISFRSMANGTALIDRWTLRRVDAMQDTTRDGSNVYLRNWLYATENGGELARADWPDGQSWRSSLGSIEVHALSSGGKPVSGALLALPGTTYRSVTDNAGNASIRELVPGPYALELVDPRLAHIGLTIPTSLKFVAARDSVIRTTVTVPTAEEYVFGKCFPKEHYTVGDPVVIGRVMTYDNRPIENARITFYPRGGGRTLSFKTDSVGVFQLCPHQHQLARGDTLTLSVQGNDENAPFGVVDVLREITEPLTVIPIKVAPPTPVSKRP